MVPGVPCLVMRGRRHEAVGARRLPVGLALEARAMARRAIGRVDRRASGDDLLVIGPEQSTFRLLRAANQPEGKRRQ